MKDLRKLIVVDVEATCQRTEAEWLAGEETEIIEIGACELDLRSFERSKKTSILIRPKRSRVSAFCTELTTITQDLLDREGVPYVEAIGRLQAAFPKLAHQPWASWGAYDRSMFEREAWRRQAGDPRATEPTRELFPFSRVHVNAKTMFSLVAGRTDGEFGLPHACTLVGVAFEGTLHRGHDDAWAIAGVIAAMLQRTRPAFADVLGSVAR